MNEKANRTLRAHNVVVVIITITCIGAILEIISQGWELWVIPLIAGGIIACWAIHINGYGEVRFRENFFMIFSMLVAFFHGVHLTSFYDIIIISVLLMITASVMGRKRFLPIILAEFFVIMAGQMIYGLITNSIKLDPLSISRIILHIVVEISIYRALHEILRNMSRIEGDIEAVQDTEENAKKGMEDFLANISHELRTPVNVINGMSTLILKKEPRADVQAIRDAGMRLSNQIEDIQDYSEIERGDAILEEEKYMITSILSDIAANYEMLYQTKGLEFTIDLDPSVPAVLKGDSKKLKKIIMHLVDNGFKFTKKGGVLLRVFCIKKDYGINLIIEVMDTGIGMTEKVRERVATGSYQADKKRNRSTGGIGLGLSIVYGFTRLMHGFVALESGVGAGTVVRISIVQEVIDPTPCITVNTDKFLGVAFHVLADKLDDFRVGGAYEMMATNLAAGLRVNLYSAPSLKELKRLLDTGKITHVFLGVDEYKQNPGFFDELSESGVTVAMFEEPGFVMKSKNRIIVLPKPVYGYTVAKVLNGEADVSSFMKTAENKALNLEEIRALIVDDEPMNLIVATGLFKDYKMEVDTAESGKEALAKYELESYDIVFMDHMMPEMDGVEAMKKLRFIADQKERKLIVIALTANAVSGAREMFLKEGFDGFISKPININDFERVMMRVMSGGKKNRNGGVS
ncbi:hybrid sensor histidine kinase/response regulator [Butyrivibrio sp. XPD2006]|uniref:hybrid sensor histidine kinase/response regulator n=1 Tax=Butyrivibrio sp. XPD2006 TaxID=1280668 RepID=UPI0018CACD87|nr:response regulator [Butyrivibrio sp. XPD2006]